ncbi:MAG: hypothetical protein ACE5EX_08925, partial [Phycisphaerae bacterium]
MIDTYLTTFPWDLLDEGLDAALDRLHGQVGLTGVCVWAASPPVRYLRTRDVKPRFFRTRGGLFFHPDVPRYESTRCRPLVAAAATAEDPLVRIADACAEHRLALRMIVAAATAPRLARAQPEMAAKNLFGDVSRRTVCLANPNVEAYLCTLAADLSSRRHVSGVILADMGIGWGEATEPPPVGLEPLGPSDRTLLSICFCESCRQRAGEHGVDVAAAQRFARAVLEKTLDTGTGPDGGLKAILDESPSLRAWFDWRRAALSALLGRIVEACGGDVVVDRGAPPSGELRRNQPDDSLPA